MNFLSSKFDKYTNKIKSCEDKLITLEKDNQLLRNQNNDLNILINKIQNYVNDNSQHLLCNTMEIQGIPVTNNDNLILILESLEKRLNLNFNKNDTCNIYIRHLKMVKIQLFLYN